jgi:putative cell wall-binding protein
MNRLPSIRRWGVAALTGVTLFGGLSIIGAGVASAATTPTVTAALTTGANAGTIAGTATGTGGNLTLTVNGTPKLNDVITLTLACPTNGTASFNNVTVSGSADFTSAVGTAQTGTTCSTLTLTATAAGLANPVLTFTPSYTTTGGVSSQALSITGTYATLGLASTSFSVPTDESVVWYGLTSNTPAVTLPATGTTAVSPITITDPYNLPAGFQIAGVAGAAATVTDTHSGTAGVAPAISQGTVAGAAIGATYAPVTFTVTPGTGSATITSLVASNLPAGMTFTPGTGNTTGILAGTPTTASTSPVTIVATDGASATATASFSLVVAPATITLTLTGANDSWSGTPTVSTVGFTVTAPGAQPGNSSVLNLTVTGEPASGAASLTINNASVVTAGSTVGSQKVTVTNGATTIGSTSVGSILGTVTTIAGADGTADGTVAAEFMNAFPANAVQQNGGNANVVLATDAPSANGSDALAASYLEGTLGTGLLITSPTSLGVDAQNAIRIEGVSTVYVVGGPLAISPAVLAQVAALPAYKPGGLVLTGSNVKVVGPIAGADGTAAGTAAAIATRFGAAFGSAAFAGAYNATGGVYNDTTGNASTTAPTGSVPTAIVVASSDWQDAMSIAPEAYKLRLPVILNGPSTDGSLDADAQSALVSLGVKQVIVIGGQLALQNSVETQIAALNGGISVLRIAGIDATDTAAQLANFALATGGAGLGWATSTSTVMASHVDYWTDALGAAAYGAVNNQPLILVENPTTIGQYTTAELPTLASSNISNLTVLGGPLAMPSSTVNTLLAGL